MQETIQIKKGKAKAVKPRNTQITQSTKTHPTFVEKQNRKA
jgi:hypothetical protein